MSKIRDLYYNVVIPNFIEKKISKNILDVPRLLKIVINIGFGTSIDNNASLSSLVNDLSLISCQKPVIIKAKKSIAGFKIRKGVDIGCKVTLRKNKMYNFLDKLLFIVLPRIRDFKGLSLNSFDGYGNYSLGIKEYTVFPDINYDNVNIIRGLDISIVTNSYKNERSLLLLKALKFPFK